MAEDCCSFQLISGDGVLNMEGLENFSKTTNLSKRGVSYAVVAIMGPQSGGKSTLLNKLFQTDFRMMDADDGRNQTTQGIWIAKGIGIEPFTIAIDVEGSDSRERGQDGATFEKQSALFALAIADIVMINMLRLFRARKTTLLFVLRDQTKIWAEIPKPDAYKRTPLGDFFKVDRLRQRFFHSISPGGLAGGRKDVQPASGLTLRVEQIWKTIKENKDMDLPAMELMVATFRCDQIAKETLSRLNSDKNWLALRKDVEARPAPKFRKNIISILESTLSQYDMEATHFKESIRDDIRKELEIEALQVLYPAYAAMLRHLRSRALQFFKTRLIKKVKRATKAGFEASIDSIIQHTMDKFEKESRGVSISKEWDASEARESLFSEIEKTKYEMKTKFYEVYNTMKAKAVRGIALGIGGMSAAGVATATFIGDGDAVAAKKAGDAASMVLIDENAKFNVDGLQDFVTATEFAQSGLSYAVVAIIGSQSSGKSTLMNQIFHTKFKEMDAYNGRSQTTKGIWIAKCSDIDPFTIVMDFEGTDSNQRGEDDAAFERQSTLFALEIADVVLINMWCKDIGLEHAASRPLLKTVFQVIKRSSKQSKKTLLFVIRDHTKTPLERLKKIIFEDIEKIWDAVPEPETSTLYEFFKVEITALPSYEFQEVEFKEQVAQLRQQFVHSTCPGGLVGDRKKVKSASFSIYAEDIWKTIKENKDLDLPSLKVMVATFRCEVIAEEILKCFTSNKRWLAIKEDVQAGPVTGFGEDVTSILETCLSEYDIEVGHFDQEVRNAKRQQLLSNALMVVHDAYDTLLMHLYSNTFKSFKTSLEQSLNEGQEYVASIRLCSQSCLREFDEGCEDAAIQQSEWNANKFRKRLICNILSEMMAKYEKQITRAIANTIEYLLEASERNTWASVRDVFEFNTEKAISEFSDAAASFDLRSSEINTKNQHLREYARNLLEMKAREEADAGRVLKRMMDRSKQVFDDYENSMSWYKSEKNLDEIERKALSKSLRILSIIAAIRYDEMPDQLENVLYSSLMDRIVPNPSLQNKPMEAVLDPLALDTWEEVSQNSTTLLKPEDCVSLWMTFKEEIKPMVTDVKSRQVYFTLVSHYMFIWNCSYHESNEDVGIAVIMRAMRQQQQ
ncbi:hypothetical protein SADUNF_Sadunf12G0075900 [Salix dunnii]|uniref:GB1/RHD3-type G domain-containing protein n=1 Tax=Salix dunnii TaxID=1413687 RepID=A0A835JLQ3_9ROSI|nr:hypothetical protein SADUNF_Sadunf12G0075900 [Salix dunnii]